MPTPEQMNEDRLNQDAADMIAYFNELYTVSQESEAPPPHLVQQFVGYHIWLNNSVHQKVRDGDVDGAKKLLSELFVFPIASMEHDEVQAWGEASAIAQAESNLDDALAYIWEQAMEAKQQEWSEQH